MNIIECGGWFLGVDQNGAYWMRPDTEEEKILLEEFVSKIRSANPVMEDSSEDVLSAMP
jgi:hypothetical protein